MNQYQSFFYDQQRTNEILWKQGQPPIENKVKSLNFSDNEKIFVNDNFLLESYKEKFRFVNQYLQLDDQYMNLNNLTYEKYKNGNLKGFKLYNNDDVIIQVLAEKSTIVKMQEYLKFYVIQNNYNKQFVHVKKMGKGSFAKVYKIVDVHNGKFYASKVFRKSSKNVSTKQSKLAIFKEIEIMRDIDHENIVHLHQVFEDQKKIYLILDYLQGGELFRTIIQQDNIYDEQLVRIIIQQLLKALRYLHSKNIMHRDLKPENLILRNKNDLSDIMIADFGLAEYYNEEGNYLFPRCGSLGYIAPEILSFSKYNTKVDIFSIGVIMYTLLVGESPFSGKSSKTLLKENINVSIDFNYLLKRKIGPSGIELLRLLLDPDPKYRFTAEEALNHKWFSTPLVLERISLNVILIHSYTKFSENEIKGQSPHWKNESDLTPELSSSLENIDELCSVPDPIKENIYFDQFKFHETYQTDLSEEQTSPSQLIGKYQFTVKNRQQ